MRKRIVGPHHAEQGGQSDKGWLDLEQIATVEVTSEDPRFPIEYALGPNDGPVLLATSLGPLRQFNVAHPRLLILRKGFCFCLPC